MSPQAAMSTWLLVLPLLPLLCLGQMTFYPRPRCPSTFGWVRDPSDCARFWRCNWGSPLPMPACPLGTVFSARLHVCVFRGSAYDDCSTIPTVLPGPQQAPVTPSPSPPRPIPTQTMTITVYEFCSRNSSGLMAHLRECQLYYNCSFQGGVVPSSAVDYLQECPSPWLFDDVSLTCLPSWRVHCGNRRRPASSCEYRKNRCNKTSPLVSTTTFSPVSVFALCAQNSTALMAHPYYCQLYYNCSSQNGVVPRNLGSREEEEGWVAHYVAECPYPLLYDHTSQSCQHTLLVDCHHRHRPKSPCEYRNNTCTETPPTPPWTPTTQLPPFFSIFEYCSRNQTALLPHPRECQAYYNCSKYYLVVPENYEQNLQECPYPQVYNAYTQRCQSSWEVDCRHKTKPTGPCDYRQHQCQKSSPSCTPCAQTSIRCEGRGDGPQSLGQADQWVATYVTCSGGRTVNVSQCPLDEHLQVPTVFSPLTLNCINLFKVPVENGGLLPSCTGRTDSSYPLGPGRPDLFYECRNRQLAAVYRCPSFIPYYDPEGKVCVVHLKM